GMAIQAETEEALAARAQALGAHPKGETGGGAVVEDADAQAVPLQSLATGAVREVRGRYVVAADGIKGDLREQVGIGIHGLGLLRSATAVRFLADLTALAGDNAMVVHYVQNPALPDGAGVLVTTDNPGEWV